MALDDYGSIIQSGMQLVPDLNKQLLQHAQTNALNADAQQSQAQAAAIGQKMSRAQQFQHDIATYDGSPTSVSKLIAQYPEYADQLKSSWDVMDGARKQADLTETGQIYEAAKGGNWALAKKLAHARADAEKAAGYSDPAYDAALAMLDKAADGDTTQQKTVMNLIGMHLATGTGPEHFGSVYGTLHETHVLTPGSVLIGDDNSVQAHSPLVQGADGSLYDYNSVLGGSAGGAAVPASGAPASGGATPGMTPAVAAVASTLASALPAPVVAGFLGNFHIEGGYTGAQGDGGSATGIAQWHDDRAANFQKIIGKPVTEATPEDQAKFVLWEMQNPEAAGMTVKQRDAIMAAKSPAQAAALIDQFYERSDGKARSDRMQAATAFAGLTSGDASPQTAGPRMLLPGKPKDAPAGFQWSADGSKLEAIPGGPADKPGAEPPAPQELEDAATQYLLTGQMPPLGNGGAGLKQQILARRTQIMQRLGIKAEQLPGFQAQYKSDQSALQQLTSLSNGLGASESALKANGQQVWNTHRALVSDGIISDNPWITRQKLKYYSQFGSPDQKADVKAYMDAVNAYSTEYSKFMSSANGIGGSAAPSDASSARAGELNDPGLAATPLLKHLRQGITEAANRRNGVVKQVEILQHKLTSYLHPHGNGEGRTVVRTGVQKSTGKRVVQYSDGTVEVQQ